MAVSLQCVRVEPVYAFGVEYMSAQQPSDAFSTFDRHLADAANVVAALVVERNVWIIGGVKRRESIQIWKAIQLNIVPATVPKLALG